MKDWKKRAGLALTLKELPECAPWLLESGRDIELQDITHGDVMEGDWQGVGREINAHLNGHQGRIGIHGPFWHLNIAPRDPAVQRLVQERLNLGLDFARAIGGTHMVVHSPFDFFGHPQAVPGARLGPELERAALTMQPIVKRAEQEGLTLVIENIYDLSPVPLLALAQYLDSDAVRLSVDTGHAHLMTQRGGPPPQTWIETLGTLLGHVHLCDNDTTNDQHLAPGRGTIHWGGVERALNGAPESARIFIEVKASELRLGREWLEQA
ncbi:sugar phosphate isomerase/epimerase [Deinococcus sp.]|uniref:sugar phosphate isomerase/epimerase family protein n=1 Tax=Deinococcus sp. TaxID=47478 RepID=UPI0025C6007F|nr:sugar phosphate isomerase/epimerase [Deinococcus sp.]